MAEYSQAQADGADAETISALQQRIIELSREVVDDNTRRRSAQEEVEAARASSTLVERDIERNYERVYIEDKRGDFGFSPVSKIPRVPFSYMGGEETRSELGGGAPTQYHGGKSLYGAVMNQLHGPLNKFATIDITIRGDPYWLGRGSFEQVIAHYHEVTTQGQQVNIMNGAPSFMFTYKYPKSIGEDGSVQLSSNELVTGMYVPVTVKHKFSGGQFTQEIKANKNALIDLFSSVLGIPATDVPEPTPDNPVPDEADSAAPLPDEPVADTEVPPEA